MPFTAADADRHIKGLSAKQKRAWAHIANGVLERCTGDAKTCDASAVRQANGAAQRIKEAEARLAGADPNLTVYLAEAILRRSASDDGVRSALQTALRDKHTPEDGSYAYLYVRDVFHTTETTGQVIYDYSGSCYQADYSLATDDAGDFVATLGDEVEVDVAYVPMADAREGAGASVLAGEYCEISESSAVKKDGTTRIKIIKPGWGSSGYYHTQTLETDGPQVFKNGLKMYWNHPTKREASERPERDLDHLAAQLTEDAKWDANGEKGPGLYANATVFEKYRKAVNELAPHIGVSIRGVGITEDGEAEGRKGKIIRHLGPMHSIDFVTAAGAGGEILSLFEAAGQADPLPDPAENVAPKVAPTAIKEGGSSMPFTDEERKQLVADVMEGIKPMMDASQAAQTAATTALARMSEATRLQEAQTLAGAILRPLRLPEETKARILSDVALRAPIKEGAIDREAYDALVKEAAKAEAHYIASIRGTSGVFGMGGGEDVLESGGNPFSAFTESKEAYDGELTGIFEAMGLNPEGVKIAVRGHQS